MQAYNSVSTRFACDASEKSRTRRIIYRIQLNNRPVTTFIALHACEAVSKCAALVNPDGVR
jgi:hypothetical protein